MSPAVHELQCDGKARAVRDFIAARQDRLCSLVAILRGAEALLIRGQNEKCWGDVGHGLAILVRALEGLDQICDDMDGPRCLRPMAEDGADLQGLCEVSP